MKLNPKKSRRKFIKLGFLSGGGLLLSKLFAQRSISLPTPREIEGPFYPITPQKDKDFDLTKVKGRKGIAKGEIIFINGNVIDTDGNAVEDAIVDIWHANKWGRYSHPQDPNTSAPLDENFQGWAIVPSGKNGGFSFKTIFPGAYPASSTWLRAPHIHFKVSKRGYHELITQMYFPAHELNNKDLLYLGKNPTEQRAMTAKQVGEKPPTYEWTIVLKKV